MILLSSDVALTFRGSRIGLGIIRVLGLQLPHSAVRSVIVVFADVLEYQLNVFLRLIGQVGQILHPVRGSARGLDTQMHLILPKTLSEIILLLILFDLPVELILLEKTAKLFYHLVPVVSPPLALVQF